MQLLQNILKPAPQQAESSDDSGEDDSGESGDMGVGRVLMILNKADLVQTSQLPTAITTAQPNCKKLSLI